MKGIHHEDTVNQDLITELRKEFRMVHDDFYMVLTDTDTKIKVRKKSYCCCSFRAGVKSHADPQQVCENQRNDQMVEFDVLLRS